MFIVLTTILNILIIKFGYFFVKDKPMPKGLDVDFLETL